MTGSDPAPERAALAALVARLEEQEQRLWLPGFDNDDAWRLGVTLVELAAGRRLPVTVDVRRGRQQLFHAALPGTNADNDEWLRRKAAVVDRFGHSSYLVGRRALLDGTPFEARADLDPAGYAAHGGAFPVQVTGVGPIGTVAVSGLPQEQDHALVVEALELYLAETGATS